MLNGITVEKHACHLNIVAICVVILNWIEILLLQRFSNISSMTFFMCYLRQRCFKIRNVVSRLTYFSCNNSSWIKPRKNSLCFPSTSYRVLLHIFVSGILSMNNKLIARHEYIIFNNIGRAHVVGFVLLFDMQICGSMYKIFTIYKTNIIITWTINRRNAIGHTPKIAKSINLDIDPLSLIFTGL